MYLCTSPHTPRYSTGDMIDEIIYIPMPSKQDNEKVRLVDKATYYYTLITYPTLQHSHLSFTISH